MLITAINGSPNRDGNTYKLVDSMLEVITSLGCKTAIIELSELTDTKTPFCTACSTPCSGVCFKGSPLEQAYELLGKSHGIIMASPVYFGTVSGQMKAFFDKTRKLRTEKKLMNVVGAAVTVGASRFGGQETTIKAIHDIMLVHGMIIVGDGYSEDDCGHHGVCAQKPAAEDDVAMKRAVITAKRLVEVCRATTGIRKR